MKQKSFLNTVAVAMFVLMPVTTFAATWTGKAMLQLYSTYVGFDCIYFTLEGVAEADPIVAGNPWFAIPRTQAGEKEAYAMLLSAKLTGQLLQVTTDGTTSNSTTSCGNAIAIRVQLQ